jgi:hypothetical protein
MILAGKKIRARKKANTPVTVIPIKRNGNARSQTMGNRISAANASGQHRRSRISHPINVNMVTSEVLPMITVAFNICFSKRISYTYNKFRLGTMNILRRVVFPLLVFSSLLFAQKSDAAAERYRSDSLLIMACNAAIERANLQKQYSALDSLVAEDFIFSHADGRRQTKSIWIESLKDPRNKYASRVLDSTCVDLHGDIGIVSGILLVRYSPDEPSHPYGIRYIRLFRKTVSRWQLISQISLSRWQLTGTK